MHEKDRLEAAEKDLALAERIWEKKSDRLAGIAMIYTTNADLLGEAPEEVLEEATMRKAHWTKECAILKATVGVLRTKVTEAEEKGTAPWM